MEYVGTMWGMRDAICSYKYNVILQYILFWYLTLGTYLFSV